MPGREEFKREYLESIAENCSKPFAECSRMERYTALAAMIRECCSACAPKRCAAAPPPEKRSSITFRWNFSSGGCLKTISSSSASVT